MKSFMKMEIISIRDGSLHGHTHGWQNITLRWAMLIELSAVSVLQ